MANSVNKVTLLGNLGADPELRSTAGGKSVCSLNIATTEKYKGQDGNWAESTEWHRVVLWERLADVAAQYLKKGSKVYIEGRLKYGSYEKDGITRYTTDIVGQNMVMLDGRGDSGGRSSTVNDTNSGYSSYKKDELKENLANDDMDDDGDVPF